MSDPLRTERLQKTVDDPFAFGRVYFPHLFEQPSPEFHKDLIGILLRRNPAEWTHRDEDGSTRQKAGAVIAAPRGHAKSSIVSFTFVIWSLLTQRRKYVLLISATATLVETHIKNIRTELENNDKLLEDWGMVRGDLFEDHGRARGRWTDGELEIGFLQNGKIVDTAKVTGRSSGSKLRGLRYGARRPDLCIVDDLEEDEQVETPDQRDKLWRWFHGAVVPMLDPKRGLLFIVGTILHFASLLNRKLTEQADIYVTRRYAALDEDGQPLWPERFSLEALTTIKRTIGSLAFSCLPGDAHVQRTGEPALLTRRHYEGRVTRITTARGYMLTSTPNHPVLTDRGWLASEQVTEGDYVFSRPAGEAPPLGDDVDHRHPTIAEVFDLAHHVGPAQTAQSLEGDFHGDGQHGQIDVIPVDRELWDRVEAQLAQPAGHLRLAFADEMRPLSSTLVRGGPGLHHVPGLLHPAVGPSGLSLIGAPVAQGAQALALAGAPQGNAGLPQVVEDRRPRDPVWSPDGGWRLPGGVTPDRVVQVERDVLRAGHVYNLQTEDHTYLANRILTHNCEYMNSPHDEASQTFRPGWFRWYTRDQLAYDARTRRWYFRADGQELPLTLFVGVDWAIGEEDQHDRFALVMIGVTPDKRHLVMDVVATHLDVAAQVNRVVQQKQAFPRVARYGIEGNGFQNILIRQVLQRAQLPVKEIKHMSRQRKRKRIESMAPIVENGRFYLRCCADDEVDYDSMTQTPTARFRRDDLQEVVVHPAHWILYRELIDHPRAERDDTADAAQMAIAVASTGVRAFERVLFAA